jgi:hypothetical protein
VTESQTGRWCVISTIVDVGNVPVVVDAKL